MGLSASNSRRMTAREMRKMQVPAYCPVLEGVQVLEYKGVLVEVKKTIVIDMDMEESVDMLIVLELVAVLVPMFIAMEVDVPVPMAIAIVVDVPMAMAVVVLMSVSIIAVVVCWGGRRLWTARREGSSC